MSFKSFVRKICMWGEKEFRIGCFSILFCDLSVSVCHLSKAEYSPWNSDPNDFPSDRKVYSYGVIIEPFMIHFMGRDGDISWSSPGWLMSNWVASNTQEASNAR